VFRALLHLPLHFINGSHGTRALLLTTVTGKVCDFEPEGNPV
jgi:hypothetical protein